MASPFSCGASNPEESCLESCSKQLTNFMECMRKATSTDRHTPYHHVLLPAQWPFSSSPQHLQSVRKPIFTVQRNAINLLQQHKDPTLESKSGNSSFISFISVFTCSPSVADRKSCNRFYPHTCLSQVQLTPRTRRHLTFSRSSQTLQLLLQNGLGKFI